MTENTLKKIFPKPKDGNYLNLSYDGEGLYSITHPNEADIITKKILEIVESNEKLIIDTTTGCGGNLISFGKCFKNVVGIEINLNRFNILKKNLECYDLNNVKIINDDCINYLDKEFDIFYIDPPWGGPNYKKNDNLELYLSEISLPDILKKIQKGLIVLKIPFNYNYEFIEQKYKLLDKLKFNNVLILFFKN